MKKRSILWLMLAFFALVLGACGQKTSQDKSDETKGMKIVTSFYPVYAMVKEVSGPVNPEMNRTILLATFCQILLQIC